MIRRIRRALRSIDYHSARRERTVWTRVVDGLLLASGLLAVLGALGTHWLIETDGTPITLTAVGGRAADGSWCAALEGDLFDARQVDIRWLLEVTSTPRTAGWPMRGHAWAGPPALAATPFRATGPPPDPEERAALEHAVRLALARSDHPDAVAFRALRQDRAGIELPVFVVNVVLWWIAIMVLGSALMFAARVTTWTVGAARRWRARRRRHRGLCPECGFDVRASVLSERCPECGALLD